MQGKKYIFSFFGILLLSIGNLWLYFYYSSIALFFILLVILGTFITLIFILSYKKYDFVSISSLFSSILIIWTASHGFLVFFYLFFRYSEINFFIYYLGTTGILIGNTYRFKIDNMWKKRIGYGLAILPLIWEIGLIMRPSSGIPLEVINYYLLPPIIIIIYFSYLLILYLGQENHGR